MNPINMTGEPNQHQTHPSVFHFDPYPPNCPINWNQTDPFAVESPSQYNNAGVPIQNNLPQFNLPSSPSASFMSFSQLQQQQTDLSMGVQPPYNNLFQVSQPQSTFMFGTSKPTQEVVHFPFQITSTTPNFGQRTYGFKRKTDSPPLQQAKQHITEEKMAEHMSKLHISSETAHPKETESGRIQRLYMCEEMRKLTTDPILPQSLLVKMEQPCKALVLWRPPTNLIPSVANVNDVDENENNNNNNGESVPDNNVQQNVMESDMENEVVVNNMDMDNC